MADAPAHSREELAALIAFHGDELIMGIALEQPREDINRRAQRIRDLVCVFLGDADGEAKS